MNTPDLTLDVVFQTCIDKLHSGEVDVVLGYEPLILSYLVQNCDTVAHVPAIAFAPMELSLFLKASTSSYALVNNLNKLNNTNKVSCSCV